MVESPHLGVHSKKPTIKVGLSAEICGVADGARTHDNRNHNPGLYQLSYSHRGFKLYPELGLIPELPAMYLQQPLAWGP